MPLWSNTDSQNSKPIISQTREVREVYVLTTQNVTVSGANTITFQKIGGANTIPTAIQSGTYVYTIDDANNSISMFYDKSIIDQNDVAFLKSNNTVKSIDSANSVVSLANNLVAVLKTGSNVYFANSVPYASGKPVEYTYSNDVILVTPTRLANTKGVTGSTSDTSNTVLGNLNAGWNRITRKINSDGTVRFLKETLVALANPVASNVSSGNTSSNAIFSGV
jgi:hypothetical protein